MHHFSYFFSIFLQIDIKKHDLCSQNVRRSCRDRAGGLGARSPSPGIWYTPTPLTAFHVWSWIHRGGPILLSELGLTSGRLWYDFCKYLPGILFSMKFFVHILKFWNVVKLLGATNIKVSQDFLNGRWYMGIYFCTDSHQYINFDSPDLEVLG